MTRVSPHVCYVRLDVLEVCPNYILVTQNKWMGGEAFKMPREAAYRYDEMPVPGRRYSFLCGKWQADKNGWIWTENYE